MKFTWDENKNRINIKKHGISFEEASTVFIDPLHIAVLDQRFSYFEERWITVGKILENRVAVAANLYFDEDGEEIIRILSARLATPFERRQYEGSK